MPTSGNTQSSTGEHGVHLPAAHQEPEGQSPSVSQTQSSHSSDTLRVPLTHLADHTQHGRGALEQLKLPVQGSPFTPRARAS